MARAKSLFASNKKSPTYKKSTKKNKEGFPAFDRSIEEDTLAVLMTNTLSNTFYVDQKKLADETVEVLEKMADSDPEFLAKALVYARNKGLMKLAPVVGLAVLSAKDNPEKKINFRRVFHHVVKIPDDLREFVTLCRTGSIRGGLGGEARDAAKRYLQHLSEYHAIKYGSSKSKDMTLRDIIRMAHPRPVNDAQSALFGWIVKGWDNVPDSPGHLPQVWAFEKIKRLEDEKEIISLVEAHKLPWEVVVPSVQKMTKGIWKALLKDMPYMALLRNLNTMERHGVFEDKSLRKEVAKRLSDPDNVAKSKQFPFRFFNAYNAFEGNQEVRDALVDALELSFKNVESLPGRVAISNDVSGSMGCQVSNKGTARYCDVAGLFAATFFKKCEDVILLPADDHVVDVKVSRRSTIMDIAKKIGFASGGTDLGVPIRHLMQTKDKVDTYIGITDNEDWAAGWYGRGFLTEWEEYKRKVNPKAKAILITIAPYRDYVAPEKYPDVHFIHGWGPSVPSYVSLILKDSKSQVEVVKAIDLGSLNEKTS